MKIKMKMKIKTLALLLLVVLAGCKLTERAALRKLERIERHHPQLFSDSLEVVTDSIVYHDTVTISLPVAENRAELELVMELATLADSIKAMEGRLRVAARYEENRELGTKTVYVSAACLPDTLTQQVPVPTRIVVYKSAPCSVEQGSRSPWWYYLLSALVGGVLTYFFGFRWESVRRSVRLF